MNPLPTAARVSGAAVVLALSGCYYPYPYGYYGAAPYPAAYPTTPGPSAATQRDPALGPGYAPAGPEAEAQGADPNANDANNDGEAPPPIAQSQMPPQGPGQGPEQGPGQGPAPYTVYAPPPPVAVAPAYYPPYPAYPAYYPYPYPYPAYYGYGPGWWGPSISFGFGFHGGYHHHH
ncbi:hypothetical protein [Paraburkholderia humisilvae]|uniref:Uncharacterized protein n=1 Tax=Paraburkholderia humisilvae TaxID=627669 RepID=A0A6J5D082_9BURK|nr:hypothetical protein [Paraburkholderia humisilvae]CAB3747263.1 hypothetical protein LMG29542_00373 [Paraburkholderia humisilvae]